jgi:hypothetical protein
MMRPIPFILSLLWLIISISHNCGSQADPAQCPHPHPHTMIITAQGHATTGKTDLLLGGKVVPDSWLDNLKRRAVWWGWGMKVGATGASQMLAVWAHIARQEGSALSAWAARWETLQSVSTKCMMRKWMNDSPVCQHSSHTLPDGFYDPVSLIQVSSNQMYHPHPNSCSPVFHPHHAMVISIESTYRFIVNVAVMMAKLFASLQSKWCFARTTFAQWPSKADPSLHIVWYLVDVWFARQC